MQRNNSDLEVAHKLADAAAEAILPHFRALSGVDNKEEGGFDPVTVADREAERVMREILASERPDDAIVGEEFDNKAGTSGRAWVLDPIDGTRAFVAGLPTWGVLIGLMEDGASKLGMMAQPFIGERFFATPGEAYHRWFRGTEPMKTRRCKTLSEATVVCTNLSHLDAKMQEVVAKLGERSQMLRFGTDCYGYAMVAAGQIDVVIEGQLKPVDIAPFPVMIEAAGGKVIDRGGAAVGPTILGDYNGDGIAVGDEALIPELLDLFR